MSLLFNFATSRSKLLTGSCRPHVLGLKPAELDARSDSLMERTLCRRRRLCIRRLVLTLVSTALLHRELHS